MQEKIKIKSESRTVVVCSVMNTTHNQNFGHIKELNGFNVYRNALIAIIMNCYTEKFVEPLAISSTLWASLRRRSLGIFLAYFLVTICNISEERMVNRFLNCCLFSADFKA
jgi:hypothetical protein